MTQSIEFLTESAHRKIRGQKRDLGQVSSLSKTATFGEALRYAIRTNDHL